MALFSPFCPCGGSASRRRALCTSCNCNCMANWCYPAYPRARTLSGFAIGAVPLVALALVAVPSASRRRALCTSLYGPQEPPPFCSPSVSTGAAAFPGPLVLLTSPRELDRYRDQRSRRLNTLSEIRQNPPLQSAATLPQDARHFKACGPHAAHVPKLPTVRQV